MAARTSAGRARCDDAGAGAADGPDYLLYGRLYVPSARLDGLCAWRATSTLQALVSYVYIPTTVGVLSPASASFADAQASVAPAVPSSALLSVDLQHDTGRWRSDCSYSFSDGMFGARVLHHFGRLDRGFEAAEPAIEAASLSESDDRSTASAGLRGRFSAGGEIYVSAKQRSAGGSSGGTRTLLIGQCRPACASPPCPSRQLV